VRNIPSSARNKISNDRFVIIGNTIP
jgi:hypothetical protein